MSKEKKEKSSKMGRPAGDVIPETPLAKRLWLLFSGQTFEEIGKIAGATGKTARSWLEGKTEPSISQLEALATWKRVPMAWMVTPPDENTLGVLEKGEGEQLISLPSIGIACTFSRGGKVFLNKKEIEGIKYGVFDVVGNDMAPCCIDGQRVLVSSGTEPEDGGYAVCLLALNNGAGCLLRRTIFINDDLVRLETINPASDIPPITVPRKNVSLMKVVGVLF